jgi:hypothetical protein
MSQEDSRKKKRSKRIPEESFENVPLRTEKQVQKIPFSVWFDRMMKAGKVKFWQEESLLVYMRKQGLSNAEAEDLYCDALKKF